MLSESASSNVYRVHSRSTPRWRNLPPTNLWAIRREWLRGARSDTNPTQAMYAR
eukprot:COSAG01_NODE_545_length_15679_cov_68.030167_4_plen_54_part_00